VADFINYAKNHGIPVGPGRGSSAGSLVAYGMNITNIDPIEYDIIFERFLNPERVSLPDIDVDFCMRGREQVIRYVAEKYDGARPEGEHLEGQYDGMRVAQIATFGTLQARAAIRDVGRVLGMSFGDVDRIAKLVPDTPGITLEQTVAQSPELRARMEATPQIAKLIETARALEGLTRHVSKHAAGVVISTEPLIDMVPLYKDPKSGDVMSQYNMVCVEQCGLIKFDFLGLKTLTLMADAEAMIRRKPGFEDFDINRIPMDDSLTFDLLCAGDTEGVFQVESSGMTEMVLKLEPRSFKEIIRLVALYRPGPLQSGMADDFVDRKRGQTEIEYLHPSIAHLTEETLGVIIYQDQVLQIAQRIAGYSLGEADLLRRAMGKKKPKEMEKQRARFVDGCVDNGLDTEEAGEVFDKIAEFAGYGFPKAHSAAYAYITYQTAYLKAHHPAEHLAALLTIESANHDKLSRHIAHAREKKTEILPPDVNESQHDFSVVSGAVRFGFAGIKNVGEGAIDVILEARSADEGPFRSLFDFAQRVDARKVNRRVVESLVKCGAFDSLHENRAAVWSGLDAALERAAADQRDRAIGQGSLFGGLSGEDSKDEPALAEVPPWTDRERLAYEKELLGFYVTGHPLGAVAADLARYADTTATAIEGKEGREVRVGGLLTALYEKQTKRGKRMAFGSLEDLEGSFELVVFAEPYEKHRSLLFEAKSQSEGEGGPVPLLVVGTLEGGDPPKILVRDVLRLEGCEKELASQLKICVLDSEVSRDRMIALRRVLRDHTGDCAVFLHVTIPGESETVLAVGATPGVEPSEALLQEVDGLFGRRVAETSL